MSAKSEMDILYENYLMSENKTIHIDGRVFYRIIDKHRFDIREGLVVIVLPREVFGGGKIRPIIDENGNTFEVSISSHYSFRDGIPQWYLETISLPVPGIHDTEAIGQYAALA